MLALSAAMVWAAGNVAMKGKLMGCDLTSLTAWQMTIGAVVLAVYNVFIGDWYRFGNCVLGRKSDAGYGNGHAAGFCRYCPGAEGLMKNKLAVLSGFMVCYWLSP